MLCLTHSTATTCDPTSTPIFNPSLHCDYLRESSLPSAIQSCKGPCALLEHLCAAVPHRTTACLSSPLPISTCNPPCPFRISHAAYKRRSFSWAQLSCARRQKLSFPPSVRWPREQTFRRHGKHSSSTTLSVRADAWQLSPEDAYLSYHDVRLTREDVQCIKDDWLTDNVIAFWQEYLEHEKLSEYPKANIVLLRPSMAFLLLNTKDPLSLKSALPNFEKTTHIFLPINDCRSVDIAEGGSHWSLLLVSVIDGVAFHYDSLSPSNVSEAKLVAYRISILLGKPLKFINLEDSPQQDNSSDCGVYVCLLMQHLLMSRLLRAHAQDKISMSMRGKEVDAYNGRKEMLRVIESRRKEGERRRSRSQSRDGKAGSKSKSPPRIGDEQNEK